MVDTSIEWTDQTWNPIRGCTRVSPGCGGPGNHGGCYAEKIAARFSGPGMPYEGLAEMRGGKARWTGKLAFVERALTAPIKVRKPTTWFVNSMSDLFHESVPDAWIDRVFAVMALCPQHAFQVLTKRSARMRSFFANTAIRGGVEDRVWRSQFDVAPAAGYGCFDWPLPNVWLGVSVEDQTRADERVPDLLATPAAVRFVSAEPLLSGIDFEPWLAWPAGAPEVGGKSWGCQECDGDRRCDCPAGKAVHIDHEGPATNDGSPEWLHVERRTLDWLIVGSESGHNRRDVDLDHVRSIRDQCAASGTAFFLKQLHIGGKKVGLPALDGRQHNEFPRASHA